MSSNGILSWASAAQRLGQDPLALQSGFLLNFPSLTEAEYVGGDVVSLLSRFVKATEGDIDAAQRGIAVIDAIDTPLSGISNIRHVSPSPVRFPLRQGLPEHGYRSFTIFRMF